MDSSFFTPRPKKATRSTQYITFHGTEGYDAQTNVLAEQLELQKTYQQLEKIIQNAESEPEKRAMIMDCAFNQDEITAKVAISCTPFSDYLLPNKKDDPQAVIEDKLNYIVQLSAKYHLVRQYILRSEVKQYFEDATYFENTINMAKLDAGFAFELLQNAKLKDKLYDSGEAIRLAIRYPSLRKNILHPNLKAEYFTCPWHLYYMLEMLKLDAESALKPLENPKIRTALFNQDNSISIILEAINELLHELQNKEKASSQTSDVLNFLKYVLKEPTLGKKATQKPLMLDIEGPGLKDRIFLLKEVIEKLYAPIKTDINAGSFNIEHAKNLLRLVKYILNGENEKDGNKFALDWRENLEAYNSLYCISNYLLSHIAAAELINKEEKMIYPFKGR